MQDGALGNGGAFVSAPFRRPPRQRTAGQTLKPPVRPLPKTRIGRRPARHDCPGRHRNPACEDPGGICDQAAGHRAPGNLLRAEQTLLEPRLATAPRPAACILIHDPPARDALCRDQSRRDRRVCGWSGYEDDGPFVTRHGAAGATAPTHLNLRPAPGHSALWRLDARTGAISAYTAHRSVAEPLAPDPNGSIWRDLRCPVGRPVMPADRARVRLAGYAGDRVQRSACVTGSRPSGRGRSRRSGDRVAGRSRSTPGCPAAADRDRRDGLARRAGRRHITSPCRGFARPRSPSRLPGGRSATGDRWYDLASA